MLTSSKQQWYAKTMLSQRPPAISFFDIYQSLDHATAFQIDTNTEPKCVVGATSKMYCLTSISCYSRS